MKLKFTNEGGYLFERECAVKELTIGNWYDVESIRVNSYSTDIYLVGFDKYFNSCLFDDSNDLCNWCDMYQKIGYFGQRKMINEVV